MSQPFLDLLKEFVAIPSISTDPAYKPQMLQAAQWLVGQLNQAGMENAQLLYPPSNQGHPAIYADWLHAGTNKPTILIYTHYDVQPPDPLDQWQHDPWQLQASSNKDWVCGRGTADDKGHIIALLIALKHVLSQPNASQFNLKFISEGEEEQGGPNLQALIKRYKKLLKANVGMVLDVGLNSPDQPVMIVGLRGLVYLQLDLNAHYSDLHSGVYGGKAINPALELAQILSNLCDQHYRVSAPGFYDAVVDQEYTEPLNAKNNEGVAIGHIEHGYEAATVTKIRPSYDVNGLWSGYQGDGSKTIIPASAYAKISFRLVAKQSSMQIAKQIKNWLKLQTPPGCALTITDHSHCEPVLVDPNHPAIRSMATILSAAFGNLTQYKKSGGTIGAAGEMQAVLNLPLIITGFTLEPSHLHAPNEQIHIPTMLKGVEVLHQFLTTAITLD